MQHFPKSARRPALVPTAAALVAACVAAAGLAHAAPQGKKLYCWEEEGRKICGDALPADAADNARKEFSARTGLQVGEVARALTDAERAALAADRADADRRAEEDAARQLRELAMVDAYATEADLRRAYRNRIVLMDDKVRASRLTIASLRESLLAQLRRAGELELAGKPVAADLAATIANRHEVLRRQRGILADQLAQRAALDQELAAALVRYRELTGPADPAPGAASQD